ncbi:mitochondrial translation initiation factor [Zychaea mexicana]|uniref:mitochondrial translation initiation factor n=1 Tax=Zychaea mexicana TaxID=64656 RepID=UPI0022FDD077|nr:mitochondrial translation initiation factor [Zychaea mexicana]KAI9488596.1 mitochondrial translation initiation factor [Zychaea mexicana]
MGVEMGQQVLYCGVCTMPPEYCEFSGTQNKCKEWLQDNHEDVYNKMYGGDDVDAVTEKVAQVTVEGTGAEAAGGEGRSGRTFVKDKSAKLEAKLERENQKKQSSRVTVKRVERTKRKCVTIVHGLEVFDVELKKAAKMFANRFACGSSVAKNNQNQDEIVVQGDFSDDIHDLILAQWKQVPEDNIDLVEETKKKKGN